MDLLWCSLVCLPLSVSTTRCLCVLTVLDRISASLPVTHTQTQKHIAITHRGPSSNACRLIDLSFSNKVLHWRQHIQRRKQWVRRGYKYASLSLSVSSSVFPTFRDGWSQRDYWPVQGLSCCGVNMIIKCTVERITLS